MKVLVLGGQKGSIGGEENHIKEISEKIPYNVEWKKAPKGWFRKHFWAIKETLLADFDFLITHNDVLGITNKPHIHVMHSSWEGVHSARNDVSIKTKIKKIPEIISMKFSEKILTVSDRLKDEIVNNYSVEYSKVKVVENGVDKTKFKPRDSSNFEKPILGITAHREGKGQKIIEEISDQLKEKNIDHQIKIAKDIPFDEMPDWYNSLSLYIHPSIYDGYGIAVAEAIACGVPAIASKNTYAKFNGVEKISIANEENWVDKIIQIIEKPPVIDSNEAKSWEYVAKKYKTAIEEAKD